MISSLRRGEGAKKLPKWRWYAIYTKFYAKKVALDPKISENVKETGFTSLLQKINERYRDQVNEKSKGDHVLRRHVNYVLC